MTSAQQRRREIRTAIRDAAIREFARNGLAGTSTAAIAQSAGITKAQLHYYISSKEELYQDALGHIVTEWRDIFFLNAPCDDPRTAIATYIARKIRHSLDHPDVSRFFASEIARGAPEMGEHWGALKASVLEANAVIEGWIAAGRITPVDPLLFQLNIWAVTQHYAEYEAQARVLMDVADGAALDLDRIIAEATGLFLARCGAGAVRESTA